MLSAERLRENLARAQVTATSPSCTVSFGLAGSDAGRGFNEVLKVAESRTGLTTARGRKVYGITKAGQQLFDELLESAQANDDDRAFALRLAFARHMPREARLRLLMRRREQLAARADEARKALDARRDRLDGYSSSLMEHSLEVAENDVSWLDRLIASEQKGSLMEKPT